jgi:hypothetical protein
MKGSQYLPQAVKAAAPIVANLAGNVGASALLAPEGERADAAKGAYYGNIAGQVIPKAVSGALSLGKRAWDRVSTDFNPFSGSAAEARAGRALENTIGPEEMNRAAGKVEEHLANAPPGGAPKTTAEVSGSAPIAAIERGAQNRGNVDFNAIRSGQEADAVKQLTDAAQPTATFKSKVTSNRNAKAYSDILREYVDSTGRTTGKELTEANLKKSLNDQFLLSEKSKTPYMDQPTTEKVQSVIDALRNTELYKKALGPEGVRPSTLPSKVAAVAAGAIHPWLAGPAHAAFAGAGKATMEKVDQAVANPEAFMKLVKDKRAAGAALDAFELGMEKVVKSIPSQVGTRIGSTIATSKDQEQ